jgi:hypothetical protein
MENAGSVRKMDCGLLNLAMKRFLKALRLCQKFGKIIVPFSNAWTAVKLEWMSECFDV